MEVKYLSSGIFWFNLFSMFWSGFGLRSVMMTLGFQLMSVSLDSSYDVMEFSGLKAGSWAQGFHHVLR